MRYLLLFSFALFGIITAWTIRTHGCSNNLSLSMHVAKSKKTSLIFGIFGSIATVAAAMAIFMQLLPAVSAGYLIYGIYYVIFAQLLVTVLLPHIDSTKRGAIHNLAAWGMCFLIPVATTAFLFTNINHILLIATIVALAAELTLLSISLTAGVLPKRKFFLYFQLAYLGLFFGHLLIMTWSL